MTRPKVVTEPERSEETLTINFACLHVSCQSRSHLGSLVWGRAQDSVLLSGSLLPTTQWVQLDLGLFLSHLSLLYYMLLIIYYY